MNEDIPKEDMEMIEGIGKLIGAKPVKIERVCCVKERLRVVAEIKKKYNTLEKSFEYYCVEEPDMAIKRIDIKLFAEQLIKFKKSLSCVGRKEK